MHRATDGAIYGARATFIGGCQGTACVLADRDHGIPAGGTMAHSWVQMFDSEYEAFKAYAEIYPDNCVFLVDTYNVLKSGVPNAIRVAKELAEKGIRAKGIRLDSGDIAYLSVEARKMLNDAGFSDMQIMASNSLDEYLVRDLIVQGAQIDSFGIGERLITSKSEPVFGGVYKLAAVENEDGEIIPKIKVSENVEKITTPHFKQVYRLFDNKTGKALGDVLTIHDEVIDPALPYVLFHPIHTWKQRVVTDYTVRPLRQQIFKNGECIYQSPSITEIRDYCMREVDTLWDQIKRFENSADLLCRPVQKALDLQERAARILPHLIIFKRTHDSGPFTVRCFSVLKYASARFYKPRRRPRIFCSRSAA